MKNAGLLLLGTILVLLIPVALPFAALRFVLRFAATIIGPLEWAFMIYGYGIAFCLYFVYARLGYGSNEGKSQWRHWGKCMTEAGFDTVTALMLAALFFKFALARDLFAELDIYFGDIGPLGWVPFWLLSILPFLIRLSFPHDDIEIAPGADANGAERRNQRM